MEGTDAGKKPLLGTQTKTDTETKKKTQTKVINEACTQEFTAAEQEFIQFCADPDLPRKLVASRSSPELAYAKRILKRLPWARLAEEVRPLIQVFKVIGELAWLEVAVTIICAFMSMVLNQIRLAQFCLLATFVIALWLKYQALRAMLQGNKLLCGDEVATFLTRNYKVGSMQFPVKSMWVSAVISLPSFAEGALTAIALPHAYESSQSMATALGVVLAWSSVMQIVGTRNCIRNGKSWVFQLNCDTMIDCDQYLSTNNVWHWVTMAAASSNLNLIAACGDQVTNKTKELESYLPYKLSSHDESSVVPRVINRFILTGGPRMALKIILFARMVSAPIPARLNMLLAIAAGAANILFILKKVVLGVCFKWQLLKEFHTWTPDYFPDNVPKGRVSMPKVFLNPFGQQLVYAAGCNRAIDFDGSFYIGLALSLYMFWAGSQMLPPVQNLIHDMIAWGGVTAA